MSDYIKREDAIKALESICVPRRVAVGVVAIDIDDAISELEQVPSADVVEVVRCKDCMYYNPYDTTKAYDCERGLLGVMQDDYCSYGERADT